MPQPQPPENLDPLLPTDPTQPSDESLNQALAAVENDALGLFVLDRIAEAFRVAGWSPEADVEFLSGIVMDEGQKTVTRIRARDRLYDLALKAAEAGGYIQSSHVRATHDEDDESRRVEATITGSRIVSSSTQDTLKKLQDGLSLHSRKPQIKDGAERSIVLPSKETADDES